MKSLYPIINVLGILAIALPGMAIDWLKSKMPQHSRVTILRT